MGHHSVHTTFFFLSTSLFILFILPFHLLQTNPTVAWGEIIRHFSVKGTDWSQKTMLCKINMYTFISLSNLGKKDSHWGFFLFSNASSFCIISFFKYLCPGLYLVSVYTPDRKKYSLADLDRIFQFKHHRLYPCAKEALLCSDSGWPYRELTVGASPLNGGDC